MNQTIKLDTRKCDGTYGEARIAPLRRGERNNALLTVKVCANGQPYDLAGKTASLVATTAAGKLVGPCPMEVAEEGIARIMLPAALYSAVGSFRGYVEIREGETLVDTTDRFGGKVIECADLDSEQAAEFTPLLGELQNAVAEEAKRVEAEESRAQAETERDEAEKKRGKAEEQRAQDSKTRLEELAQAKTNAETATVEANTARDEAKKAATDATSAAGMAADAAGLAETAKTNANTAAEEANSAATKAEASARKADSAAETAVTAASTAERAANKADTAAGNAEIMAEKADASANKADIAAGKANEATVAATNAATKANEVEAKLTGNVLKGKVKETSVHVDDAFPSTILGIEIEGATEQVTTTGKNLLNGCDSLFREADSEIKNYLWGYTLGSNPLVLDKPLEAGTYTFSVYSEKGFGIYFSKKPYVTGQFIDFSCNKVVSGDTRFGLNRYYGTFTLDDTYELIGLYSENYKSCFGGMIEKGSTVSAYEPYTDGKPSPSPEYPQQITVVENPVLHVTGRNLFDGEIDSVGNSANPIYLSKGTYTISLLNNVDWWSNSVNLRYVYIHDYYKNIFLVSANFIDAAVGKRSAVTFNLKEDATVKIYSYGAWKNENVSDVQIERGSVATEYKPYTSQSLAFTLPAEHPYLAKLPDGTADEIIVDKDGNVELVARVGKAAIETSQLQSWGKGYIIYEWPKDGRYSANGDADGKAVICQALEAMSGGEIYKGSTVGISVGSSFSHITQCDAVLYLGDAVDVSSVDGAVLYYPLMTERRYPLGKIEMPKAQDSIVNVWTDAEVTPRTGIEYTRDVNIVVANLESAIASIS